jgi:hypothetical protein
MSDDTKREVLAYAIDPGMPASGEIELFYERSGKGERLSGPFVEVYHPGVGSMRVRFDLNPDNLRRFFIDGHAKLGEP